MTSETRLTQAQVHQARSHAVARCRPSEVEDLPARERLEPIEVHALDAASLDRVVVVVALPLCYPCVAVAAPVLRIALARNSAEEARGARGGRGRKGRRRRRPEEVDVEEGQEAEHLASEHV